MRWIFLELFRFSRIICFIVIYFCCNTLASSVDHILHNIGEKALEISDLQSQNVNVTFDGDQWIAVLTCEFQYEITADVSWHVGKTGNRADPDNPTDKMVVTNVMNDGTVQSTLTVYNFVYDDVGQYTCLLAEPKGYTNKTLWVAPLPTVDYDGPGFVVEEDNTNVTVSCTSFPGAELFFRFPCIDDPYNNYLNLEIKNVTDDGDVNKTIAFSFTADARDASEFFLCCMNMPSHQQQQQCTMFPIYVKGDVVRFEPAFTYCSSATNKCIFGGVFAAYPFLNDSAIIWTDTQDAPVTENVEIYPHDFFIYSNIEVFLNETNNYTLTATDDNGISNNYTFFTEDEQFGPLLLSVPVVNLTDNQVGFSAKFSCLFTANPDPTIHWLKLPINGYTSKTLMEITSLTLGYNISSMTFPATKQTLTALEIPQYENVDKDVFICIAVNKNGISSSQALAAYKQIGDLQLNILITSDSEVNAICAECSAKGYPPPKIYWRITAEFDVVYSIDDQPNYDLGATISNATIMDLGNNSFIDIQCVAFDHEQNITAAKWIDIKHKAEVLKFTPCTPDKFTDEGHCTMTCDFQSSKPLVYWEWTYYVADPDDSLDEPFAIVSYNKSIQPKTPYRNQVLLTMTDYNAGWYRCMAVYQNTSDQPNVEVIYHNFRISEASSVNMGDPCSASHECISLYATCTNGTCQCSEPNIVPYDDKPNTLACLTAAGPGDPCFTDAQCEVGMTNYVCRMAATVAYSVCTCIGRVRNVTEDGTQQMCLHQVDYGEPCQYNEECEINDFNMHCDVKCKCATDYKYDDFLKYCVSDSQGKLSPTSIAVTVLAVFFAIALAVSIIGGIMKNRRHKPSRNALPSGLALATRSSIGANDSTGELPYTQFSDLTLEVDGASIHSENA